VLLFAPNLVGYARLALLGVAACVGAQTQRAALVTYWVLLLSFALDGLDGVLARRLCQVCPSRPCRGRLSCVANRTLLCQQPHMVAFACKRSGTGVSGTACSAVPDLQPVPPTGHRVRRVPGRRGRLLLPRVRLGVGRGPRGGRAHHPGVAHVFVHTQGAPPSSWELARPCAHTGRRSSLPQLS